MRSAKPRKTRKCQNLKSAEQPLRFSWLGIVPSSCKTPTISPKSMQGMDSGDQSLTCLNCRNLNPEGSVFCEKCGAKLAAKPSTPVASTAPPVTSFPSLPLFTVPVKLTVDSIRSQGEATKVGLSSSPLGRANAGPTGSTSSVRGDA